MKSKAVILFIFFCVFPRSHAARPVTVDQLRQAIASAHGKSDTDVAWQLGDMRLTERLSVEAAASLSSALPGEKSQKVLAALADASQFQEPPANEASAKPAPTLAELRTIMKLAVTYVVETVPHLPNFTATRVMMRYEETPKFESGSGFFVNYEPLHFTESIRSASVYNQGREEAAAGSKVSMHDGLITRGDFGPILSTVLLDAAQNKLAWSRWDGNGADALAVFSYSVPVEKSHYEINYCCFANAGATRVANLETYSKTVGYHGSMFVEPATGAIRRLIVQADLKPTEAIVRADVLVDYAPVEIGGTKYFCPVHSVTVARAQSVQLNERYKFAVANQPQPLRDLLNDTSFEEYQLFHAEGPAPTH
jgi:hypothetical protein